jgi:hypothetical protein
MATVEKPIRWTKAKTCFRATVNGHKCEYIPVSYMQERNPGYCTGRVYNRAGAKFREGDARNLPELERWIRATANPDRVPDTED